MSNRLFQGVVHQMRDTIGRVIGVIDENATVVACSELARIGTSNDFFSIELGESHDIFIRDGGHSTIDDVCAHIEHFLSLGGENNIAMGADLDGVNALPAGIANVSDLHKIGTALHERGVSDEIIEKIFWGNLERVIQICL